MKRILPLVFALSVCAAPVLAWGGGDCSYSKKGLNQESSSEKVDSSKSSEEK